MARQLFSPEHEEFRASFRKFLEKEVIPHHEAWEERGYVDREVWQKAGANGFLCPSMPEQYGGAGADRLYSMVMMEETAKARTSGLGFSLHSHQRARAATLAGAFKAEIVPVQVRNPDGSTGDMHSADEGIRMDATYEGISGVKLLREGGYITAASASQICDGASGVVVVNERGLKSHGVKPMARVHHMTMMGGDPVIMLDAPLHATERALKKAGMSIDDIDLFEVNEAFASVPTAWLKTTGADPARLNVNGGAIALGHPLGGSGTKLMTTLINALKQRNKRYGLQTMCEGGGMANVTIVERL